MPISMPLAATGAALLWLDRAHRLSGRAVRPVPARSLTMPFLPQPVIRRAVVRSNINPMAGGTRRVPPPRRNARVAPAGGGSPDGGPGPGPARARRRPRSVRRLRRPPGRRHRAARFRRRERGNPGTADSPCASPALSGSTDRQADVLATLGTALVHAGPDRGPGWPPGRGGHGRPAAWRPAGFSMRRGGTLHMSGPAPGGPGGPAPRGHRAAPAPATRSGRRARSCRAVIVHLALRMPPSGRMRTSPPPSACSPTTSQELESAYARAQPRPGRLPLR